MLSNKSWDLRLHLAALASLKGDIVELNKRLQQTERERDLLEKKLAKAQCEQSHLMREHEDVQERTTLRYEERITELHSIIAELNKKIDRLQGTTIREEDEYSELRSELSQSQHEVNEDSRSLDQDQTSVSIPENHSTVVTADMGESARHYHKAWVWFLDSIKNFRNMRQPEFKFN
ncbi:hypothetical protein MC885_017449 [Smutsia gigantea]|nr:hypothetical protein MC885_017449 [Smutsia gigantea]